MGQRTYDLNIQLSKTEGKERQTLWYYKRAYVTASGKEAKGNLLRKIKKRNEQCYNYK